MKSKFCLSKNGFARQYFISLEKEHYDDTRTPLDFCQNLTSELQRSCNVDSRSENRRRKHNVVTTLVFGRSNDIGNTTL